MTTLDQRPTTTATHPLAGLTADEITTARDVLTAAGLLPPTTRVAYLGLVEPHKAVALAWTPGEPVERRVRAILLDVTTGASHDTVVSVSGEPALVSARELDTAVDGQPPVLDEEFGLVDEVLRADEGWIAALRARGVDPAKTVAVPLSAGSYGIEGESGARVLRSFVFVMDHPGDSPWAHPVDGLVAYVDITTRTVREIVDDVVLPVPTGSGNTDDPALGAPPRGALKPIEITQPEGPSWVVDGEEVSWGPWTFRVGFDAREGLVLRQLAVDGRPVVYRASISEMLVPYADPSPTRFWQNYFDAGEYVFGRYTNSLQLGCDCLGEIHYFDAVLADEVGAPRTIENAICLHEEDASLLWKHTDVFTGKSESRRQRRLVISFVTTVGNYDYGFYWHLYLDGTIECEAKLTGVLFTSAYPGGAALATDGDVDAPYPYASEVAPGLGAPYHQHLFNARLDMMVDGVENTVTEVEAVRVPRGPGNPYGNAFTSRSTVITSEADAARESNGATGRVWHVSNPTSLNRYGKPVSYVLHSAHDPVMLADDEAVITDRGAFATKHLWVTAYDPAEQYAAGDFVNQHAGGAGLPAYQAADRPLEGADLVLWHTFGPTHFPRPEDWPVMPVDHARFSLKPYGFYDCNPTLNSPATPAGGGGSHCHGGE